MIVATLIAAAALAAPPQAGVLVPGKSLGGLLLGETPAQVRRAWGTRFGRCRNCSEPTWYFNYTDFRPEGVGVTFHRGRVGAVFTVWQPPGWHTREELALGDAEARITSLYGALPTISCGAYTAYVLGGPAASTVFYAQDGVVFGFGLSRPGAPACR